MCEIGGLNSRFLTVAIFYVLIPRSLINTKRFQKQVHLFVNNKERDKYTETGKENVNFISEQSHRNGKKQRTQKILGVEDP